MALGELQHGAAVAWRELSKWRALKKKEHLGFLAEVTEEEHIRPDVFRGAREVFVPERKGLRSPSVPAHLLAAGHQGGCRNREPAL